MSQITITPPPPGVEPRPTRQADLPQDAKGRQRKKRNSTRRRAAAGTTAPDDAWLEAQRQRGLVPLDAYESRVTPSPEARAIVTAEKAKTRLPLPPILRQPAQEGVERGHKTKKVLEGERSLEENAGHPEWLAVYDAFQHSGAPEKVAELTSLPLPLVDHLLSIGLQRLGLPPIRLHATNIVRAHQHLEAQGLHDAQEDMQPTNAPQEVQDKIAKRVAKEIQGAQENLDVAVKANSLFAGWISEIQKAIGEGRSTFDVPEQLSAGFLDKLYKALTANTAAMERAVKLNLLVQGRPTETIQLQALSLLAVCSREELEHAERHGSLPQRLLGRRPFDAAKTGAIDVESYQHLPDPEDSGDTK